MPKQDKEDSPKKLTEEDFKKLQIPIIGGQSDDKVLSEEEEKELEETEKPKKEKPKKETLAKEAAKKATPQPKEGAKPFVKDQELLYPDTVRVKRREYMTFDLGDAKDAVKAGEYETFNDQDNSGIRILHKDIQFDDGTWKCLLQIGYLSYINPLHA